jgi:hypothetical protein
MGGGERAPHVCGHHSYPQLAHRPVGQKISKIYRERIGQFYSRGQWDKVNLLSYVFDEKKRECRGCEDAVVLTSPA